MGVRGVICWEDDVMCVLVCSREGEGKRTNTLPTIPHSLSSRLASPTSPKPTSPPRHLISHLHSHLSSINTHPSSITSYLSSHRNQSTAASAFSSPATVASTISAPMIANMPARGAGNAMPFSRNTFLSPVSVA